MRICISSNYREAKGLAADAAVLTRLLESAGHTVIPVQFDDNLQHHEADLLLFLEVINPSFVRFAPRRWLFVNPEWLRPSLTYAMKWIELVCCKTHDAVRLMQPLAEQVVYTGFASCDHYNPGVRRRKAFLHCAGQSTAKNTEAVLAAWRKYQLPYPLTVIAQHFTAAIPNVKCFRKLDRGELIRAQNEHQFHIMASEYEGFGMSLHESLTTGAVVITGDYPPLNEFVGCPGLLRVPSCETGTQGIATTHKVSPTGIMAAVDKCWALTPDVVAKLSHTARMQAMTEQQEFAHTLLRLVSRAAEAGAHGPLDVSRLGLKSS